MRSLVTALLGLLVGAAILTPVGPAFSQELYGWTISASNTDPFVQTASPEQGFYSLYAWLVCINADEFGFAGFRLDGSLIDRVAGVVSIPPFGVVMKSGFELAPYVDVGPCLTTGMYPVLEIFVLDDTGSGGDLCFVETDSGANESCNCDSGVPTCFPHAVRGFASDGTTPCMVGNCQGPISIEAESWGGMKGRYR